MPMPEWYEEARKGMDPATLELNNQFNDLVAEHSKLLTQHPMGLGILMVMGTMGPRQFAEDHQACALCSAQVAAVTRAEEIPEDLSEMHPDLYDGDKAKCPAVVMATEVTKFADECGHPEWVAVDDPLMGDDLPISG